MAAIDLLFDVKRDSERLHQLVLGALLQRTLLLSRLVPFGSAPTDLQLHWEPEGKAYDLAIGLGGPEPGAGGRRSRVLVEVKLDSPLSEDRVAQQLSASRLHAEDRLLYLLLGYSAITSDRAGLRERIRRIGEHTGRSDLLDRVSLRDVDDLAPLLADPALLPAGADHHDARDLASAYRDALLALSERTRRFSSRPVTDWQDGDFYGFFAACRARGASTGSAMARARIGRVAGPEGSVVGCTFAETPLLGSLGHLDLHFENGRLCLRVHAAAERKALRQRILEALGQLGLLEAGAPPPLGPLSPAPPRLAAAMIVAQRDGLLDEFPDRFDWARFFAQLASAEAALRKVAAGIGD